MTAAKRPPGCLRPGDRRARPSTSAALSAAEGYVGALAHPSDDATGLIYMRARWMDPVTGRFVSEDPGRDGVNWFAYAGNNPVSAADADGRKAMPFVLQTFFVAMVTGFFMAMGYADACGDIPLGHLGDHAKTALYAGIAAAGLAYLFQMMYQTEGLGSRIPMRLDFNEILVEAGAIGYAIAAGWHLAERAGECAWELFRQEYLDNQ